MKKIILSLFVLFIGHQVHAQELLTSEHPEPTENALFGWASAIHIGYAVVTAPQKDIGDNQSVGSAFYYRRTINGWEIIKEFSPDGLNQLSNFGISADIKYPYMAVGSLGDPDRGLFAGAVYLYTYNDTSVTQVQKLTPSDAGIGSQFGYSLDLAFESNILAVGAYQADGTESKSGAVYIFETNNEGDFLEVQKLVADDGKSHDYFGRELVFLSDDMIAVSAYNADGAEERSGAVYIFERNSEDVWEQTAKLFDPNGSSSDLFGYSLSPLNEIYVLVKSNSSNFTGAFFIGAPGTNHENGQTGSVYIFERNSENVWSIQYQIIEPDTENNDHFGISLAHNSVSGLFVGASRTGLTNEGKIYNYRIDWEFDPDAFEQLPFAGNNAGFSTEFYGSKLTASSSFDDPYFIFATPYQTLDDKTNAGTVEFYQTVLTSNEEEFDIVNSYRLDQNYPNPFNPSTTINYSVKDAGLVRLSVFNLLGQEVQVLVNEQQIQGSYTVNFNASSLASGFYFYRLEVNDFVNTKKMLLIK